MSAVMLPKIGPVKPFLPKVLIAHSEACGAPKRNRPRTSDAGAASAACPAHEGGAHEREPSQRGDRRRDAAGEAVLAEDPAPERARSARPSRPGDRTGGGGAYRETSRVSAVMLARIGPVKPFLYKDLTAHSEACGRAGDGPPARSRCARAATQAPRRRRARPREGDAQARERGQRGDRRRHAAGEAVVLEIPAPQRARSARPSRQGDRTGGSGVYSATSRVSAVMLARIGPLKPLMPKDLIAHSEACGRAEDGPPTRSHALAQRRSPAARRGRTGT